LLDGASEVSLRGHIIQSNRIDEENIGFERHNTKEGALSLKWLCGEIFREIGERITMLIVLDPPAFQKTKKGGEQCSQAYKRFEWGSLEEN